MGEEVFIVAIVFGSIISIVFLSIVGSIIKARFKSKNTSVKDDEQFLEALREFKEKTDRRLKALENKAFEKSSDKSTIKEADSGSVQIPKGEEESKEARSGGKLKNMLKE